MTNICFYISDYGYGHASRDIAIIRKILNENKDVKIFVKTDSPFHFLRQSLPQESVQVIQTRNDVGVVFKENSLSVDMVETEKMLKEWLNSWDEYIHNEKTFCENHNVDVILSDIVPQPFIVADELNIPGIAISDFTWYYIFYNLFGGVAATERIKEAYECADVALVLPFNEEMNIFEKKKEINLVSREITINRCDMRKKCGVSDDELLVYVGVGKSLNPTFLSSMKPIEAPDVKFLVSSNADLPFKNVIRIPNNDTETQNYIGMCDLVVSKTGYGTVSEAVRAEIPMFLLKREGFKEDELIGGKIEEMGIGKFISEKSFLDGAWVNEFHHLDIYTRGFNNLNGRFRKDGAVEIFEAIQEMDKHDILEK